MAFRCINIYLPEEVDSSRFPSDLYGHFEKAQDYKVESSWLFYVMLRNQGIDTRICHTYPQTGILLIHKAFAQDFVWNPELLVVSLQWDYKRDDRAQVHLVSNLFKTRCTSLSWLDRCSLIGLQFFVQPPMHPYLVQRSADRGDRFENIAFIGAEKNLDPEFRTDSFKQHIKQLGMRFLIVDDSGKMTDYSEIDAVLAVRKKGKLITHKPAQKLVNAWRAGVPALLGHEMGYQELHDTDIDYLEINSANDAIKALKRLKEDVEFRELMIQNGLKKGKDYSSEAIEERWCALMRDRIIPAYHGWLAMPKPARILFLIVRWIRYISRITLSFVWHKIMCMKPSS